MTGIPSKRVSKTPDLELPDDPGELFAQTQLALTAIAKLYAGRKGCSYTQLMRKRKSQKWDARRKKYGERLAEKSDDRASTRHADMRVKQLERFQMVESLAEAVLKKLGPKLRKGVRLLGEKEGGVGALKSVTQVLEVARSASLELVDAKDDRVSDILAAAAQMADGKIDDVEDWNVDEELREALVPKAMDDLSFSLDTPQPAAETKAPETAPPAEEPST